MKRQIGITVTLSRQESPVHGPDGLVAKACVGGGRKRTCGTGGAYADEPQAATTATVLALRNLAEKLERRDESRTRFRGL